MLFAKLQPFLAIVAAGGLAVATAGRADAGLVLGTNVNGSVTGTGVSFDNGTAVIARTRMMAPVPRSPGTPH